MTSEKRILFLSDLNSVHTQRWAFALANMSFKVSIVGLHSVEKHSQYLEHTNISTYSLELPRGSSKLSYLMSLPKLLRLKRKIKPHIVHAHFASSYGFLGALTKGVTPYFVTLWGGDVLIFPKQGMLQRLVLKFNLCRADKIFAASEALKEAAQEIHSKSVTIVPFGIDLDLFKVSTPVASDVLTIGTVKGLEDIYGIDLLIKSFGLVKNKFKSLKLKLVIAGSGSREIQLKELCCTLGIQEDVEFTGKISHALVPEFLKKIDIFVALSRSESFGVAILEAQASGKAVIVSNVGGLPEVVEDGQTGIIVPTENTEAAAHAISRLIEDQSLRFSMGTAGRQRVVNLFDWKSNVKMMIQEYETFFKPQ